MKIKIKEAALILDRDYSGWYKKINVDRLNMERNDHCILGQLYIGYINSPKRFQDLSENNKTGPFGIKASKKKWKKEIIARLRVLGVWQVIEGMLAARL